MKPTILCVGSDASALLVHDRAARKRYLLKCAYDVQEGRTFLRRAAIGAGDEGGPNEESKFQFKSFESIKCGELLRSKSTEAPVSVILVDLRLPEKGGVAFLNEARRWHPDAVGVLVYAPANRAEALEALAAGRSGAGGGGAGGGGGGVFRCIEKSASIATAFHLLELCCARSEAFHEQRLRLDAALGGSLRVLAELMQSTDGTTFDRSQILRDYVRTFYHSVDASGGVPEDVELAAIFRAVGGLAVPGVVLHKARTGRDLTFEERRLVESMPEMGARLLAQISGLEQVAKIVRYQSKGFDGSGFPEDGVKGDEIPFGARLMRVMSDILRLEAAGLHRQKALCQLELDARLYDPEILRVCNSKWRSPSRKQYERVNRVIPVEDLGLLDVLARPLHTTTKMFIAPEGTLITRVLLKKIRDFEHLGLMSPLVEISVLRPLSPDLFPVLRDPVAHFGGANASGTGAETAGTAASELFENVAAVVERATGEISDSSDAPVTGRAVNE
jgi:response regulator RpfG family c-di-GMP phosphodiesterase